MPGDIGPLAVHAARRFGNGVGISMQLAVGCTV